MNRRAALWVGGALCVVAVASSFVPRRGVIVNDSHHVLWVVETDGGRARAHLLAPGRQSPDYVDADGVRSEESLAIEGHGSWWKVRDVSRAVVDDSAGALAISCIVCKQVQDDEFGTVVFDRTPDWGQ